MSTSTGSENPDFADLVAETQQPSASTRPSNQSQDSSEDIDRSEVIGHSLRWSAGWCLRFMVIALALAILGYVIGLLWTGILPIILSIILCTVLWSPVRWMAAHKVPKALAVILTMLGGVGGVFAIFYLMAPNVISQSKELADNAVEGLRHIQSWLNDSGLPIRDDQINELLNRLTSAIQEQSGRIASEVVSGISVASSLVITFFLVIILTFFFLKDGDRFLPMVRRLSGKKIGFYLSDVLTQCWNTLSGFINAQAKVSLVDAVGIGLGLVVLQVPLAFALAVLTFFAGFIPIVGAFTAGAAAVLVALVSNGLSTAVWVLVLVLAVQQLESNILSPWLQSKAMNLHPVVVLLSVAVGGALFGIIGAFLAVPAAAMVAVIFRYVNQIIDKVTENYPDLEELERPYDQPKGFLYDTDEQDAEDASDSGDTSENDTSSEDEHAVTSSAQK